MKSFLLWALIVGLAVAAPASKESKESKEVSKDDETFTINKEFFVDQFKVYTAEHEIVSILVPLNELNFDDDDDDEGDSSEDINSTIFFVEADVKDGVKDYKGLYVLKNRQAKKLLETGTDAAADNEENKLAYFAATDGLYIYNDKENTAEKYGTITDSLIGIAKVNGSDIIYVLTDKNELYKVTEQGTKKTLVEEVEDAKQIVLDYYNNLYFYSDDKQPWVYSDGEVKKIEGLPTEVSYINLVKPPFIIEDGVPAILENKAYIIYANGSSELTDFEFDIKPSAYGMEATLIQYYGYDKSIYEYNVLLIILGGLLEEMKSFFENVGDQIESIATRSRTELRA